MSNLRDIFFALGRQHTLPIHELERINVLTNRTHVRPFTAAQGFSGDPNAPTARGNLSFNIWDLMHATKKAELLVDRSPAAMWLSTLGSLVEHFDLFANVPELRLQSGASQRYGDFSSTTLAGQLAQGITFLFMQHQGYPYGERLESLLDRIVAPMGNAPSWGVKRELLRAAGISFPSRSPDFIFENDNQQTALAESKGAFTAVANTPDVKPPLRDALDQLNGWNLVLRPAPHKAFAVAPFLREEGDTHAEPSMIVFVDPPNDDSETNDRTYRADSIFRANYASSLRQMGFRAAASSLASGELRSASRSILLPQFHLPGTNHSFGFVPLVLIEGETMTLIQEPLSAKALLPIGKSSLKRHLLVVGIEIGILRQLSATISNGGRLADITPLRDARSPSEGPVVGSTFSDGTFLGLINTAEIGVEATDRELYLL